MSVVQKDDKPEKLRIWLDPSYLNQAIVIPKYHIPRTEDLIAQLAGKSKFSVFDMTKGFWQMELDPESSLLTTFQTPFGRYRFLRMCFGICSAPEIFMRKIVELFGDIKGVFPYFDDLIIAGVDDHDHDRIFNEVLARADEHNIRFNRDKMQYKQNTVKFLGLLISSDSVQIDEERCAAIRGMPTPQNRKELLRFLGMIKYVANFIPNLSTNTESLRVLTRANVQFNWGDGHQKEFDALKNALAAAPVLRIFDPVLPITVQTDASKTGLGACLLQNDQPVAYASRALTATEIAYAPIEKELLGVVYALEKFHLSVYGAEVNVITDHRPLVGIMKKPFAEISTRLQRLRLRLLKYRFAIHYTPGREMYLADTLSRAYINDEEVAEHEYTTYTVHACNTLIMSQSRVRQWQEEVEADVELKRLKSLINGSWPSDRRLTPTLRKFKTIQHRLSYDSGILYFDNRLIVPQAMKNEVLQLIHVGHLGPQRNLEVARRSFYWPGIT